MESSTFQQTCSACHKSQSDLPTSLKRCAKCPDTFYCSRECQKEDWKNHKRVCASRTEHQAGSSRQTPTGPHNPGFDFASRLVGGDSLDKLPEKDVFNRLIDCFRLRIEDEYKFTGEVSSVHMGEDSREKFEEYLELAESRSKLLPAWWNPEKKRLCKRLSVQRGNWSNINQVIEKSDIQDHYNDPLMPMKLRVLGEKIYGRGFM
jgi:splicing suppressor protein 51